MKTFFKISFLISMCAVALTSCEKALNNAVPDGTPRREFYNTQIKGLLTNDSVWVTQILDKGPSKFRIGFSFAKDGTNTLYNLSYVPKTVVQQLNELLNTNLSSDEASIINFIIGLISNFSDASIREIFANPNAYTATLKEFIENYFSLSKIEYGKIELKEGTNTFGVYGDFDSSLTFFNSSFLSDLKQKNQFDFDFLIKSYHRDSLSLEGYYSKNLNRFTVIKPVSLPSLRQHINAVNITVNDLGFETELRVGGNAIATDGRIYLNTKFKEAYDDLNKTLKFKSIPGQTVDPLFNGITALTAIYVPFIVGSPNPAAGTVLARFTGYNGEQKGSLKTGVLVELVAK